MHCFLEQISKSYEQSQCDYHDIWHGKFTDFLSNIFIEQFILFYKNPLFLISGCYNHSIKFGKGQIEILNSPSDFEKNCKIAILA